MMKSRILIITLILLGGAVACVPIPHRYQYDPNIEGKVELGGANSSPSAVGFFRCSPSVHECVTDQKLDTATIEDTGTFKLTGTRKFAAYAIPMAHCNWQWNVEFYDADSNVLGSHTLGRYGPCLAPEIVKLECAVAEEGSVHCDSFGI